MATYGLTPEGFSARPASVWRQQIRDDYESLTGLSIDWEDDTFLGNISTILADRLGALSQAGRAVYDSWDLNNATGVQLSNLALLVGVTRNLATYSTATGTFTGTAGTTIPVGSLVEGGGEDDDARWKTTTTAVVGGGGTVDVPIQATTLGAISAVAGQIDRLVTPVAGLSSVTNAADATVGQAYESDADLRVRRAASLQIGGASSNKALRANLLALDFLTSVAAVENDKPYARVVSGVGLPANSIRIYSLPSTLTDTQKDTVAQTIWAHSTAGIEVSANAPADVTRTITTADDYTKTVEWNWGESVAVAVVVTVVLDADYVVGDVDTAIQALITAYFEGLVMGRTVYDLSLEVLAASVAGVLRAEATIGGLTYYTPNINQVLTLSGTPSVTL